MDESELSKGECEIDRVLTSLAIRDDDDGTGQQVDETGIGKRFRLPIGDEKKDWNFLKI
jgi:hypothetical protein